MMLAEAWCQENELVGLCRPTLISVMETADLGDRDDLPVTAAETGLGSGVSLLEGELKECREFLHASPERQDFSQETSQR
jgi:hypothetical protein